VTDYPAGPPDLKADWNGLDTATTASTADVDPIIDIINRNATNINAIGLDVYNLVHGVGAQNFKTFDGGLGGYTAVPGDGVIAQIGTMSAPRTVTLPAAGNQDPTKPILVMDRTTSVSSDNPILVSRSGTDTMTNGLFGGIFPIINGGGWALFYSNGQDSWTPLSNQSITDPTLGGNTPSDLAPPTQKAVNTALANALAAEPELTSTDSGKIDIVTLGATTQIDPSGVPSTADLNAEILNRTGAYNLSVQVAKVAGPETIPRVRLENIVVPSASGTIYLHSILLPSGYPVANISFTSNTTAAGTPTNWWFALTDNNFLQLRATANQTTRAWPANTSMSLPLASPFTTTYWGIHYLAICVTATTLPTLYGVVGNGSTVNNIPPRVCCLGLTGQTVPRTDGTNLAPSPAAFTAQAYAYVSQ